VDSILDLCKPRPEILAGTFNPEVFTAALSPIIEFYRGNKGIVDNPYTGCKVFFRGGYLSYPGALFLF